MSLLTILLVIFIVLKAIGLIAWSWWIVLTPLWIALALYLFSLVTIATISRKYRRRR